MIVRESVMVGRQALTLESGRLAKQADGAVLVTCGGTQVLVTVCRAEPRRGGGFFPLTCDYVEKIYAGGRIPGGFFKREARQRDEEILTCRIMDRPCRPLFPEGFFDEVQVIATVMSSDGENRADMLALTGASAALHLSSLPWDGPIAGIRVGRVNGELIANPTIAEIEQSDMDIVVAASHQAIVMVEGGAKEISERDLADALLFAHEAAQPVIDLIEELRAVAGRPKQEFTAAALPAAILRRIAEVCDERINRASRIADKHDRYAEYSAIRKELAEKLTAEMGAEAYTASYLLINEEFEARKYHIVRAMVLNEKIRIDGRDNRTVRPITIVPGVLARTHGSALFQRGETQAIATTTLGTSSDEQKLDGLSGEKWKRFFLHYNFPPFSTGEVKPLRSAGRREIGHGALAERALAGIMPPKTEFPYTVRVVSETLESNGSSSMAATCGGCLALMDAGVPIKAPVAGIAMGLIHDGERYAILSDILGDEDHLGDMDFKVTGTAKGITAIQMDIKVKGLNRDLLLEALDQAREGRLHILGKMLEALPGPRPELSPFAPRIVTIKVKPDQVRMIIGPGGKTIRGIVDQTGARIDVEDDGTVNVASADGESLRRAIELVKAVTAEPEIGKVYDGVVRRVTDFGAFVEILPNWDGLVHISELAYGRTERVEDVCKEGDPLTVKVLSIEDGKVRLSHRETLPMPEGWVQPERAPRGRSDRGDRPGFGRSDRDRDRGGFGGRDRGDRDRRPRDRDDRDRRPRGDDRDRPPRDRDERPPREGEERPPREGEERPPREGEERPLRDREERPLRDRDARPPRDREERPPRDREERPPRDREARPPRDREERPRRDRDERDRPVRDVAEADRPARDRVEAERPAREPREPRPPRDARPPRDGERAERERRPRDRDEAPRFEKRELDDAGRWDSDRTSPERERLSDTDMVHVPDSLGQREEGAAEGDAEHPRRTRARSARTVATRADERPRSDRPVVAHDDADDEPALPPADEPGRGWGLGDRPRLRSATGARGRDREPGRDRGPDDAASRTRDRGAEDRVRERDGDRPRSRPRDDGPRPQGDAPRPRDDDRPRSRPRDELPRERDDAGRARDGARGRDRGGDDRRRERGADDAPRVRDARPAERVSDERRPARAPESTPRERGRGPKGGGSDYGDD